MLFEGEGCWDERMEHVGKHLEAKAQGKGRGEVRQGDDELLVRWASREGIIAKADDGFRLVLGGAGTSTGRSAVRYEDDEDAEGEEE